MIRETEKEYKFLITKERFDELLCKCSERYAFLGQKMQSNYYYDTADNMLNKSEITVRVRKSGDEIKLQIKKHRTRQGSIAESEEYSHNITEVPSLVKIPRVEEKLYLKGVLNTERIIYKCGKNSVICLDKNTYLGCTDYEIEIEVIEDDENCVLTEIQYLNLEEANSISKSSRFFKELEKTNTDKL